MKLNVTTANHRRPMMNFMSTRYVFFVLIVLTVLMLFAAQLLAGMTT